MRPHGFRSPDSQQELIMRQSEEKIYGLIGYPLMHSFSQTFFNQKFKSEKINARYINFEIPDIGDLMEVFAEHPNLAGLNVTIPYKQQVMAYLNDIDPVAQRIGAVNVIRIIRGKSDNDFRLVGYNSDIMGFANSIKPLLKPWRIWVASRWWCHEPGVKGL